MKYCLSIAMLLAFANGAQHLAARPTPSVPDLTQGGQRDNKHDWNLGPTGARGWIWGHHLETTNARQILITQVDEGSPAAGILAVGDVILGVDDKLFDNDARKAFGGAITAAETEQAGGLLRLIRWRDGERANVGIELPVLGSYSDSAPWDCPKTDRIVAAGLKHCAKHLDGGIDGKINALALLASGDEQFLPRVQELARRQGPPDLKLRLHGPSAGKASWSWGYTNLFLCEYYLATGDVYVLPAIREYSTKIAEGQSGVGSWGHGMAWPEENHGRLHGRLGGYGALNQAGLVCYLSLVLAKKCGVEHDEIDYAIGKSNEFFAFYVGKGTIPYGDHRPNQGVHDDNGKNSIAAVAFDLQQHDPAAGFFSRMVVASYQERERGHTGNYFSYLWGPLGANRAGPEAAAAFLKEQRWFYDLGRTWKGSFPYQGGAGMGGGEHQYGNWDCTGAFLLAYLLPRQQLHLTGKTARPENYLTGEELAAVIDAGREFSSWNMGIDRYRDQHVDELLAGLESWSPAVRSRAAVALAEAKAPPIERLLAMLKSDSLPARYGACEALGNMKSQAAPAVPMLTEALQADDLWTRIQACYALSEIGAPAKVSVPELLRLAAKEREDDPREMTQRYLAFGLFYRGGALKMVGLIARSLEGVDRELLYPAVKKLLENPDGRARGAVGSVYDKLSYEEVEPLLPYVVRAIEEPAPSGVMFASGIRMEGLKLLAKHRIAEGMPLCLETMDIEGWGKRHRISRCLETLQTYGGAAKPVLPMLRDLEQRLLNHHEARGLKPQIELVRATIAKIEADKNPPLLRHLHNLETPDEN
ncbi:MAG: DUF6288 domain-containing protein [Pirellulales bacterium]